MARFVARSSRSMCFVALLACSIGCHISDYDLITDNNQTSAGGGPQEIRDTRGKAKMVTASQWATLQADGVDEVNNFVRQNADGSQTLTSINNFSVAGDATFSDDLYCSPENEGCAARKSFDKDPTDPDEDPFDAVLRQRCPGARSICVALSTGRYYGECGRTGALSLRDRLSLWNMADIVEWGGQEALFFEVDRSSLSITLTNDSGLTTPMVISGELQAWARLGGTSRGVLDASHPLLGQVVLSYGVWVKDHSTETTTVTGCYQGICREWTVAGRESDGPGQDTVADIMRFASRF